MSPFEPLTPERMDGEAKVLRETILASRARVDREIGLVAPDGSLRGPFGPLLRTPAVGHAVQELGLVVRSGSRLDAGVCETVILVVARAWDAGFEWDAHRELALAAGVLGEDDVARIALREHPADPRLALAAEFAEQQVRDDDLDGETWAAALAEFGERGVTELTVLVAYYEMVSRLIRTCGPDLERSIRED
jgi:4-carboxymuconolactone decarboxylase